MENSSLLLVEGKSDANVIKVLCQQCGIAIKFEIEPTNGISELKTGLKTYLKSTQKYKKLWVIIDADTDFNGAWQSIKDILLKSKKYNIISPNKLAIPREGIIIDPIDPSDIIVGVWIMPNNTDLGMLEDFWISNIPVDDKLLRKSVEVIKDIETHRAEIPNLFKAVHKSKAEIHTWLSWHNEPGQSLAVAVTKRLFEVDAELCLNFRNWLNKLNDW